MLHLIRKWLKAGVMEEGEVTQSEAGTPQGATISPLLANIYLHYVLDLWADRWRRREATGDMIVVRFADDTVIGFQYDDDAKRFLEELRIRLEGFSLSLHPDKTRLLRFGRFAAAQRKKRGLGKPETFTFLGFVLICGRSLKGDFLVHRKTRRDRMQATLKRIKEELRLRWHLPIPEQGRWLKQVVTGFYAYHAVPTNGRTLSVFRTYIARIWKRALNRRSQRDRVSWQRIARLVHDWLPPPLILHPWPSDRFDVKHPRREPYA